jgi:Na+/alanine symporter
MQNVRRMITELVWGLLAWALVLGLGISFTFLVKSVSWRVLLPLEFALLGLVVLAAALAARKTR